ncbi:MAG: aminotransferase class V-fold PLP-dependent enzyme [Nocardioidaceae bacterium]
MSTPGSARPTVWGDESEGVAAVLSWATSRVFRRSDPLTTARPAAELEAAMGRTISEGGIGADRALEIFKDILVPATRSQDDPMNLAYVPSAPTRSAAAFELATSASNIFAGLWEVGAGAIHAENQVLAWIASLLRWPETAGGVFVAGGTMGNLSALVAARHTAEQRRLDAGLPKVPEGGWLLACTAEAHSSIRSNARVMGVDIVTVPGDERGRLTGRELGPVLDREGSRVFAVSATAGTTNAGIVDDLAGVAAECRARDVWLHVDGAYGGAGILAPSVAHLYRGIEDADSFIVDPHKWLFAPYDACALVYRRPELARAAHRQTASYLDVANQAEWNPADMAIHLSRRPRGLSLWFSLATHGTDRYRQAVEQCLTTARIVAEDIRSRPTLRLLSGPELSVLLFDRPGWTAEDYAAWSHEQAISGQVLCIPTRWQGEAVLRMIFVNPGTDPVVVGKVLDTLG